MPTDIEIACEKCLEKGVITIEPDVNELSASGKIEIEDPCPLCGGKLSAPSGRYKKDSSGKLVRTGDFDGK
ncbi:MAG: hypothetical protein HQK81_03385 [Desulfovibrionaceae bacterium]|nr:hypothetical protein [Desulfovibrionaceae bacterium]MBF0513087.1 hypothetical protein [Desulfovibrionaceae bacterium]